MAKTKQTYLIYDGRLYKIGESLKPQRRLISLKTANPFCDLLCAGTGVSEKYLHELFYQKRRGGEWFDLSIKDVEKIKRLIKEGPDAQVIQVHDKDDPEFKKNEKRYYELRDKNKYLKKKLTKREKEEFKELDRVHGLHYSDATIKRSIDAKRKGEELNRKYKIKHGQYSGRTIGSMTSTDEYNYCKWFLSYLKDSFVSKRAKGQSREYRAFSWWVRVGYKRHAMDVHFEAATKKIVHDEKDHNISENPFNPADYIIDFGKYKGSPIIDLLGFHDYQYCLWLYKNMLENQEWRTGSDKYRAFEWWVEKNKNQYHDSYSKSGVWKYKAKDKSRYLD